MWPPKGMSSVVALLWILWIGEGEGSLVTDFQQIDSNILDNANIWFTNQLDSQSALEFSVLSNTDFAEEKYLTEALQDWIGTKPATTQKLFYYWIEDLKHQSQLSRRTFEEIAPVLPFDVSVTFRRALVCFFSDSIQPYDIRL